MSFQAQVRAVFSEWWKLYGIVPDAASVNMPSAQRMAKELGVLDVSGPVKTFNVSKIMYSFGAKIKLRRPGRTQSPVEFFSYSRLPGSNKTPNALSVSQEHYLNALDATPAEHTETPDSGPQGKSIA